LMSCINELIDSIMSCIDVRLQEGRKG
jgi:hypothetical protein